MAVVWGALFGLGFWIVTRNRPGAWLAGALVVSHWVLDLVVHRPDLPLDPFSGIKAGLGLWNHPAATLVIEAGFFLAAAVWYYRTGKPHRKKAFWLLVLTFLVIYFMNVFGPPPPSEAAVSWAANLMWLFVIWAWWIEKRPKPQASV
jgi:hypothetical protein